MRKYDGMTITEQIDARVKELIKCQNPVDVVPASEEADKELLKLSQNLKVLTNLIFHSGAECVFLEKEYNTQVLKLSEGITEEHLKEIGVVKSDKFKHIKFLCTDQWFELETMRNKHKYFINMKDTYTEWINVYKKIRNIN